MLQRIRQGCAGWKGLAYALGGPKLLPLFAHLVVSVVVVFLAAVAAYADLINLAVGLARCPGSSWLSRLSSTLSRNPIPPCQPVWRSKTSFPPFRSVSVLFLVIMRRQDYAFFFSGCIKNCWALAVWLMVRRPRVLKRFSFLAFCHFN